MYTKTIRKNHECKSLTGRICKAPEIRRNCDGSLTYLLDLDVLADTMDGEKVVDQVRLHGYTPKYAPTDRYAGLCKGDLITVDYMVQEVTWTDKWHIRKKGTYCNIQKLQYCCEDKASPAFRDSRTGRDSPSSSGTAGTASPRPWARQAGAWSDMPW